MISDIFVKDYATKKILKSWYIFKNFIYFIFYWSVYSLISRTKKVVPRPELELEVVGGLCYVSLLHVLIWWVLHQPKCRIWCMLIVWLWDILYEEVVCRTRGKWYLLRPHCWAHRNVWVRTVGLSIAKVVFLEFCLWVNGNVCGVLLYGNPVTYCIELRCLHWGDRTSEQLIAVVGLCVWQSLLVLGKDVVANLGYRMGWMPLCLAASGMQSGLYCARVYAVI